VSETKELLRRGIGDFAPVPDDAFDRVLVRRDRRQRNRRIGSAVVGIAVAVAAIGVLLRAFTPAQVPADRDLGIFTPFAGRIVVSGDEVEGLGPGLWAIDPNGPTDEVPSTLVPLGIDGAIPLGWSSDGTELLFYRTSNDLFPDQYLFVLRADGTEIKLNDKPMVLAGAAISPDGSRVAFAGQARGNGNGLFVVDTTGGGRPVRLVSPGTHGWPRSPTFSPDGAQIAYSIVEVHDRVETHVWVMDSGGGNAHEILTDQAPLMGGPSSLQWSPTGDRLVLQIDPIEGPDAVVYGDRAIFTFAPDGSGFTRVIAGGRSPYWSPDGSQIAYTTACNPDLSCSHLAIAEADGSNIRGFGFAASGPWHPGNVIAVEPQP
jgi:Tol biopolymer transport system component